MPISIAIPHSTMTLRPQSRSAIARGVPSKPEKQIYQRRPRLAVVPVPRLRQNLENREGTRASRPRPYRPVSRLLGFNCTNQKIRGQGECGGESVTERVTKRTFAWREPACRRALIGWHPKFALESAESICTPPFTPHPVMHDEETIRIIFVLNG